MKPPSVLQFAPQICRHDAVGNEVFALRTMLGLLRIDCHVCCDHTDVPSDWRIHSRRAAARFRADTALIHYSHGSASYREFFSRPGHKTLVYHNITPPEYFRGSNRKMEEASRRGRLELPEYASRADLALAHSSFSARELAAAGFRNVAVLPYVLWEPLYRLAPDPSVAQRFASGGWVNLLTVGRVAPHKRLEDCLFVFDYFKRFVRARSRFFIVGHWDGNEAYLARLQRLVAKLGTPDVYFTGRVPQETLVAFFQVAGAFLCMSEHEGFCVPLVEAMRSGVPVFAYASTAVPETLRGAGVLLTAKSWPVAAEAIGLVLEDSELRRRLIADQHREARFYSPEAALERLRAFLEEGVLNGHSGWEQNLPATPLEVV